MKKLLVITIMTIMVDGKKITLYYYGNKGGDGCLIWVGSMLILLVIITTIIVIKIKKSLHFRPGSSRT